METPFSPEEIGEAIRITGGQTRWINELKFPLMKIFKIIRTIKVLQYIQFWFFDSLHIILPGF